MPEPKPETAGHNIGKTLGDLAALCSTIQASIQTAGFALQDAASKEWPGQDDAVPVRWHTREETPPAGRIWASDGEAVWLIYSEGKPIEAAASRVLFWTRALIPLAPKFAGTISGELASHGG